MSEFERLGVHTWLAKQCTYMALKTPTAVQQACIPPILAGKHVVGGAATGSGKTAAFALPILQVLSEDMYGVFALVLTPSRELAYQIVDQFIAFGAPLRMRSMLAIGGVAHDEQVALLQGRPHIVVATPGRLLHLLRTFSQEVAPAFRHLRFIVLDEADRLTEGEMQRDVRAILRLLKPTPRRQALLFSATMSRQLTTLDAAAAVVSEPDREDDAEPFLSLLGIKDADSFVVSTTDSAQVDPDVGAGGGGAAGLPLTGTLADTGFAFPATLSQTYLFIPNMVKLPYLVAALRAQGKEQSTIVFTNSCVRAELVRLTLQLLGFPVCSLNSLLSQKNRLDNLALFKLRIARIMVATDIASRGLDIPNVGLVIHYDVPKHASTYVHRVGRTARAGHEGVSVALTTEYDVELVQRIERRTGVKMALWREKGVREAAVVKILDEVSAAKVQAKQLVDHQFGTRALALKEQAAERKQRARADVSTRAAPALAKQRKEAPAAPAAERPSRDAKKARASAPPRKRAREAEEEEEGEEGKKKAEKARRITKVAKRRTETRRASA